ncbi:hypothetical protein [Chryseobacterium paridis]|uniref:Lipoprotein n=1 Tax=Chryseobacterium paridis TaxID=2800328 RepID=A0ABS1FNZ8_9FLAO|nr:hypothetical protein [Chryseobacterium paridis]MBK1894156.1 hypothetical protein [Chryseobacterium paridis]
MKKSLLLIPLIMISCKKEATLNETTNKDSVMATEQPHQESSVDSVALRKKDSIINNSPVTKHVLKKGVMRSEKDGQIIRTADASQLPFTVGEQFTKEGQELILKITNYNKSDLKAAITTKEKDFNIRFNQIKLPNGDYDGPFGRDIFYQIAGKGEVWLIIGKSNMASGNTKGSFSVTVE